MEQSCEPKDSSAQRGNGIGCRMHRATRSFRPPSAPRVRCPRSQFVSGLSARRGIIKAAKLKRDAFIASRLSRRSRHSRHLVIFACLGFLGSSKTSASRPRRRRRHRKLREGLAKMRRGGAASSRGTIAVIMETNATSGTPGLAIEGIASVPGIVSLFAGFCEVGVGGDAVGSCRSCISRLKFRRRRLHGRLSYLDSRRVTQEAQDSKESQLASAYFRALARTEERSLQETSEFRRICRATIQYDASLANRARSSEPGEPLIEPRSANYESNLILSSRSSRSAGLLSRGTLSDRRLYRFIVTVVTEGCSETMCAKHISISRSLKDQRSTCGWAAVV